MIRLVITDILLYASTALDLLVILMLLFNRYHSPQHRRQIYLGQFLGSCLLIIVSLIFAFVLHYVPQKWLLGFLGIIPIILGTYFLFIQADETAEAQSTIAKREGKNLIGTLILITIASCGSDNIGLFVPYFVSLTASQLAVTLLTFLICIVILIISGDRFAQFKPLRSILNRFGTPLIAIIYIALGIMIIVEGGTVQHLIAIL